MMNAKNDPVDDLVEDELLEDESAEEEREETEGVIDETEEDELEDEADADSQLKAQVEELEDKLAAARNSELRAQADYQNLQRRTVEERNKMARFAAREILENILQPLDHLLLAKNQLKDKGLDMVWQQFQQVLNDQGLEEIEVMGKKFDPTTMEVIDQIEVEDKKQAEKVVKVTQPGYKLNGEVIRHAKVVVGIEKA